MAEPELDDIFLRVTEIFQLVQKEFLEAAAEAEGHRKHWQGLTPEARDRIARRCREEVATLAAVFSRAQARIDQLPLGDASPAELDAFIAERQAMLE
jgi:hypothetical protein